MDKGLSYSSVNNYNTRILKINHDTGIVNDNKRCYIYVDG